MNSALSPTELRSPLESFLRDFVEASGGIWDEVEPQVYDILLPPAQEGGVDLGDRELARVVFDPDALPEHPQSQLASFGSPLIDRLLAAATHRGRCSRAYRNGLNLMPHGLAARVERNLTLPEGMRLDLQQVRAMFFPMALFWFQATFVSHQREYQIVPVGFDLHYARQVRHLDPLLDSAFLADRPDVFLPDAKHATPAEVFSLARQEVVRTLAPLANARARELNDQVERQAARMERYYADMLVELEEQQQRAEHRGTDLEKYGSRRQSLEREQRLRIAELRQKSALYVHLQLVTLLVIRQPKLRIAAHVLSERGGHAELELVFDPLVESLEAVPCPQCQRPTFTFVMDRLRRLACAQCASQAGARKK